MPRRCRKNIFSFRLLFLLCFSRLSSLSGFLSPEGAALGTRTQVSRMLPTVYLGLGPFSHGISPSWVKEQKESTGKVDSVLCI
jgi:hypothetical protein